MVKYFSRFLQALFVLVVLAGRLSTAVDDVGSNDNNGIAATNSSTSETCQRITNPPPSPPNNAVGPSSADLRHELVFLDTALENYEQLLQDIRSQNSPHRHLEVVLVTGNGDGVEQVSEAIARYENLDAVHVVSHGSNGVVKLGNTWLSLDNVNDYIGQITNWQDSLTRDADLLFYGCDLASNKNGKALVELLGKLCDCDAAASTDGTGHTSFGGDWELEYTTGQIETAVAFSQNLQLNWGHLLSVNVDATSTGTSSGGNFSVSHTTSGADRLMLVGVSINIGTGNSVTSIIYDGSGLTPVGTRTNGDAVVEIWSLVNPSLGTHNVDITFNNTTDGNTAGVMTFTGVDQTVPLGAFASASGNSGSGSATVSSALNELVFGVIAVDDSADYDLVPDGSQTEDWDLYGSEVSGGGSTKAGAASVNMSWTWSGSDVWTVGGVSIKPLASPPTYYVRTDGNDSNSGTGSDAANAWATVAHAATQSLSPGDIVYVQAGTYTGEVKPTVDGTGVSPITFIADTTGSVSGWSAGNVIVQAPSADQTLDLENCDYLHFIDFKLVGVTGHNNVSIELGCDEVTLEKCEIYVGNQGVHVRDDSSCTLINCLIRGADFEGLDIDGSSSNVTVWNSTLVANSDNGVQLRNGTLTLTNSIIASNGGYGLQLEAGTMNHTYNLVYGNSPDYSGTSAGTGEVNSDPLFVGGGDYRLQSTSPAKDAGTSSGGPPSNDLVGAFRPQGSGYDMGCYELLAGTTTYYVSTDGNNGNSGTGSSASEAWATVAYAATQSLGPGDIVYVRAGTYVGEIAPTVDGTSVSPIQFIADTDGSIFGTGGDVIVQANSGEHALEILTDDYLEFIGFQLQGHATGSDAVEIDGAGIVLEKCEVFDGTGAGIDMNAGSATLINCLIYDNSSDGITVNAGTLTIWNSTIADNNSDGIEQHDGTVTITNSIFAFNSSDGLDLNSGTMTHTYNLVYGSGSSDYEGTSASTGEISLDPLFMSSSNYQLECNSPASDAGTNAAGTVDDDLAGSARPLGNGWDLGCYEGSGLHGHWKLDETSGTTAVDASSYGRDGTYTGSPTLGASGVHGKAATLNASGTGDYIDLPSTALDGLSTVTVAFWIKTTRTGTSTILGGAGTNTNEFIIYFSNDVSLAIYVHGTPVSWTVPSIADGQWHHFAVVMDSSANEVTIYRDAVSLGTKSHGPGGTPLQISAGGLIVGQEQDCLGGCFQATQIVQGDLDDVRIYCYALSATEVAELYGLIGHWKFDEGAGSTAADSTVFANDATLSLATWTTDCNGVNALEFDGAAGIAQTDSNFTPPSTGTVAFWMRGAGTPAARQRPFGVNGNWEARLETDGTVAFDLGASPAVSNQPFSTVEDIDDDQRWYHIIAAFNAADDTYEVYVNGDLEASGVSPVDLVEQTAGILSFGTRTGSTEYWEGAMRDFRVYNRWLSGSEISELSGLVAYWKLDESSGSVAVDSSPNGNDGTLSGNPTWTTAGNIDGALDLETTDGVDQIDVGNFDVTGDQLTIAAWIKPENGVTDGRIIIKSTSNTVSDQYWGMAAGASLELDFRLMAGGTTDWFTEVNVLGPGKWNHVTGTYDGTTMRMYVNGREVGSKVHAVGGALDVDDTAPVIIGDSPVGGRAYDGRLDDIQVFGRAMCPEEVFFLYRGGRPAGIRIIKWVEVR